MLEEPIKKIFDAIYVHISVLFTNLQYYLYCIVVCVCQKQKSNGSIYFFVPQGDVNSHARIKENACTMGRANAKVASMAWIVAKNLMLL